MKKSILCLGVTAFVMLALPWLAVRFVRGDAGMAVCFLLFFAIDPLCAVAVGLFAGKETRARRFLPLAPALLFLAGTWICFDPRETAFLLYAAIYLALGTSAMLISAQIKKRRG